MGETEDNVAHYPLDEVAAETRGSAKKMLGELDTVVARHLAQITPQAGKAEEFVLNGQPWIGHLVSMREDFRGVKAFESFALNSGFEAVQAKQEKLAAELQEAWKAATPKERFEGVLNVLPRCFLLEGCTPGFISQMKAWQAQAGDLKLSEESLERYENVLLLEQAWRDGMAQYRKLWNAK
jgi:hypothetical protein